MTVGPAALGGTPTISHVGAPWHWYGLQPAWQVAVEAEAQRLHREALTLTVDSDSITYLVNIDVPGRKHLVPTKIIFHRIPPYELWGLIAEEYPRVFAAAGQTSPHRMPDDSLCLYYPGSPPEQRWKPSDGLLKLIDVTRTHIFFEDYWRQTGGPRKGHWLGPEQPHGISASAA